MCACVLVVWWLWGMMAEAVRGACEHVLRLLGRGDERPRDDGGVRLVRVGVEGEDSSPAAPQEVAFGTNEVTTSKYTVLTFVPINMFEQFTRVANVYFAIIAALQLIPGLSPTHWFTTVMPLGLVLAVNAVKEIYDDYFRHISDREVNARSVAVIGKEGAERKVEWRNVEVGMLLRVDKDQEIPADLLLVSSSEDNGVAYVETGARARDCAPLCVARAPLRSSGERRSSACAGLQSNARVLRCFIAARVCVRACVRGPR